MSDWTTVTTASEVHGSVEENVSFFGPHHCTVTLRCPWADRISVAADMILNSRSWPDGAIAAIADSAMIKPEPGEASTDGGGKLVYQFALVTVKYTTLNVGRFEQADESHDGILYSETIEQIIENQTLDPSGFCWGGDRLGQPLREGPVRQMYSMSIKRVLYNLTSIPSAFFTLGGTVNQDAYASVPLGKTFAAETLLFIPGAVDRTVMASGSKGWHVPMKLAIKPDGWNKFWNPHKSGTDKFDTIWDVSANVQYKNFPPADWSSIVF